MLKIATSILNPRQLRPYCNICGWRKGGPDSWDGKACKCKHTEPPIQSADETDPVRE